MATTSPLDDFSRLLDALPDIRPSLREERLARRHTNKLLYDVNRDDHEWKLMREMDSDVVSYVSRVLDESALRVYNNHVRLVQASPEHRARFKTLTSHKAKTGVKNVVANAILSDATPMDQMIALDHAIDYMGEKWSKEKVTHRLVFDDGEDDVVPVVLNKQYGVSTMHTVLGTTRGKLKAPKYPDYVENPDLPFVEHLTALEIVRQPHYGATVLKHSMYGARLIDGQRRFSPTKKRDPNERSRFACAELKGQNDEKNYKNLRVKVRSSGYNALMELKKHEFQSASKELKFEEFSTEGYCDDGWGEAVAMRDYMCEGVYNFSTTGDTTKIDEMTTKLFLSVIGPSSSASVNQHYAETLPKDEL